MSLLLGVINAAVTGTLSQFDKNVQLDSTGRFTYDYKYGRTAGDIQEYIKSVPFDMQNIPKETLDRFRQVIPETFTLIRNFSQYNDKNVSMPKQSKIE